MDRKNINNIMNKVQSALQRTTDTKDLIIGAGVVARTAEMFAKLFPGQAAIIVADLNTWEVAGTAVFVSFDGKEDFTGLNDEQMLYIMNRFSDF